MSALKVDNLSNNNNSFNVSTNSIAEGYSKAWVNFNGTGTIVIRDKFNVNSITDNGIGDYTVNFTNALVNNGYATNVNIARLAGAASGSNVIIAEVDQSTYSTTSVRFLAQYLGLGGSATQSSPWDPGGCFVSCHASPTT